MQRHSIEYENSPLCVFHSDGIVVSAGFYHDPIGPDGSAKM